MKNIRIGSNDYTVEDVKYLASEYGYLGKCNTNTCTIFLDSSLNGDRWKNTIIHEVTHGVFYEAGFSEQDEDMINRIANVLHGLLRDNDFSWVRD